MIRFSNTYLSIVLIFLLIFVGGDSVRTEEKEKRVNQHGTRRNDI